jgi:hypothetical protein
VINTHEQHEFWEMYDLLRQALMRGGRFVSAVQDEDLEFLESVLRGDWSARARSHFLAALAEGDAGLTESVGAAACLGGWRAVEQLLADRAPGCGERVSAAVQDVLDNVGIPRGDRPR